MSKSNIFQKEVSNFLRNNFIIAERLDDANSNRYGNFQVSKKPYDFYGALNTGQHWGAEVKMIKQYRFPVRNLQDHQRIALSRLEDNNCLAWLFINWRFKKSGLAMWIPFTDYCDIEYLRISDGIKSVIPDDFDSCWFLERIAGGWKVPETHRLYNLI